MVIETLYKNKFLNFAKWIALNAQPLAPNIGKEWTYRKGYPNEKFCVTTEELFEILKKELYGK